MAVDCAKYPKYDLCLEEGVSIGKRIARAKQQRHYLPYSRSTVRFVFLSRRCCRRLARVFLRQSQPPLAVAGETSIEPLDDEHALICELRHLAVRDGKAIGGNDLRTQPLVFDGRA